MINFNGDIIDRSLLSYSDIERLIYGDGFFETMKYINGEVFNYFNHLDRIKLAIKTFKFNITTDYDFLGDEIEKLGLNDEKTYRLRILFIRKNGGKYTPTSNEYIFVIESELLKENTFQLNKTGKTLGISTIPIFSKAPTNNIKAIGNNHLVLNSLQANNQDIDELVFKNELDHLTECTSSNIFIIKGECIYTPPIESGCVKGTMRSLILSLVSQLNLSFSINKNLTALDLESADEIFITNAIQGVQWIQYYKDFEFVNTYSKKIIALLNNKVNSRL